MRLCSVPATPPIRLTNPFGNFLPLSYKSLIFSIDNADLLSPTLGGGGSPCVQIKRLALINLTLMALVSSLSPCIVSGILPPRCQRSWISEVHTALHGPWEPKLRLLKFAWQALNPLIIFAFPLSLLRAFMFVSRKAGRQAAPAHLGCLVPRGRKHAS